MYSRNKTCPVVQPLFTWVNSSFLWYLTSHSLCCSDLSISLSLSLCCSDLSVSLSLSLCCSDLSSSLSLSLCCSDLSISLSLSLCCLDLSVCLSPCAVQICLSLCLSPCAGQVSLSFSLCSLFEALFKWSSTLLSIWSFMNPMHLLLYILCKKSRFVWHSAVANAFQLMALSRSSLTQSLSLASGCKVSC